MATSTFTINGVMVQAGDEVEATIRGTVIPNEYGSDLSIQPESGYDWWVDSRHTLKVTKKAGPPEPAAGDAMVETTDAYGSKARWIKRGSNWVFVSPSRSSSDLTLASHRTWEELTSRYKNVVVLSAAATLPKGHKVRDLNSAQYYKRISGNDVLTFRKSTSGLDVEDIYTLKRDEAIALAWDILKVYGQVQ